MLARQPEIEHQQLRLGVADHAFDELPITRLRDDLQVRLRREQHLESLAQQHVVLCDHDASRCGHRDAYYANRRAAPMPVFHAVLLFIALLASSLASSSAEAATEITF